MENVKTNSNCFIVVEACEGTYKILFKSSYFSLANCYANSYIFGRIFSTNKSRIVDIKYNAETFKKSKYFEIFVNEKSSSRVLWKAIYIIPVSAHTKYYVLKNNFNDESDLPNQITSIASARIAQNAIQYLKTYINKNFHLNQRNAFHKNGLFVMCDNGDHRNSNYYCIMDENDDIMFEFFILEYV